MARSLARTGLLLLTFLAFVPAVTLAQSGIAGVVTDATGAVLPGVTVEASSPALIEKTRIVVTDGQGLYKILDLRPGTYVVTFTLAGFNAVRREGIELPASFTASVNAEMRVGAVEETITVSGQAPAVDIQNVTQRSVLSNEFMEALPVLRGPQMYVAALPAARGVKLGANGRVSKNYSVHNSRSGDAVIAVDGFATVAIRGTGGSHDLIYGSDANIQELVVELGTGTAERQTGGTFANMIPKEGSNTFSGFLFASYTGEDLQANNLTADLKNRGLTSVNKKQKYWDLNPAFGGRIVRDKLWFYSSARHAGTFDTVAGMYYDTDPFDWVYTPDLSRQAVSDIFDYDVSNRLTWQATPRNKVTVFYEWAPRVLRHRNIDTLGSVSVAPEATTYSPYYPNDIAQVVWRSPLTSRILVEAGMMRSNASFDPRYQPDQAANGSVAAFDQLLNMEFRAPAPTGNNSAGPHDSRAYTSRASVSYITGSHALKFGTSFRNGNEEEKEFANGSMQVTLANGVPRSVTLAATPAEWRQSVNADLGVFAQDQWTYKRVSLSLGLRYDYFNSSVPPQELPAGRFVPARSFEAVKDVPNFHDLSPRLGTAYDLFGDSKTALKLTVNRYPGGVGSWSYARGNNPVLTSVRTATRTWNDVNRDYNLDCDLLRPELNGECGGLSNVDFGRANPRQTRTDEDTLQGFGKRPYSWETSVVLERELVSSLSVSAGYFRRWYGNFTTTDNLEVGPADYDPYCITAPTDPRLPGGGGNQICGLYNIKPVKFGQVNNFITFTKNFEGTRRELYNGADLTVDIRLANGGRVSGGLSTGRTAVSNCLVVDSPEDARFCNVSPPFLTNVRFMAVYPLPWWGVQTSAVFQSIPGQEITASYVARNAEIRPSLNRDLASGPNGTANVALIPPGTLYDKRGNQLDLRVSKVFTIGRARLSGNLDLFNLFNGSAIAQQTTAYGPRWLVPRDIQPARSLQFGTTLTF